VNEFGDNAPMRAVMNSHTPLVHSLLKNGGARISDADGQGRTALSITINFGHSHGPAGGGERQVWT
jgi:ankyrin repeat protein